MVILTLLFCQYCWDDSNILTLEWQCIIQELGGFPISYLQRAGSCVLTLANGIGIKCNVDVCRLSQQ